MGSTNSWKVGDVSITRVAEFESGGWPHPAAAYLDVEEIR